MHVPGAEQRVADVRRASASRLCSRRCCRTRTRALPRKRLGLEALQLKLGTNYAACFALPVLPSPLWRAAADAIGRQSRDPCFHRTESWSIARRISVNPPVSDENWKAGTLGQQSFEPLGLVERADQRELEPPASDHVLRDLLDVLGGHRVETVLDLLRIDCLALEHLA